jgi:putative endonuclease
MPGTAYVYILASRRRGTLYTGVTSNLAGRLHQHRKHSLNGFTSKHGVTRLVWYVQGEDISSAIALEKKIKNRGRQWKVDLIETGNPDWDDLVAAWTNRGSCDFTRGHTLQAESAPQAECSKNTPTHASRGPT